MPVRNRGEISSVSLPNAGPAGKRFKTTHKEITHIKAEEVLMGERTP
jgi:hypothetical protein